MQQVLLLAAVALALGVSMAYATARPAGGRVAPISATATDCTRYHPDTSPDIGCGQIIYNLSGAFPTYESSSFAYRDDNYAEWNTVQSWQLYYRSWNTLATFDQQTGTSGNASEGNSGGVQSKAACGYYNDPQTTYNHCTTDWH